MKLRSVVFIAFCTLTAVARAQTSYPMLMSLDPVAIQVGTTAECTLASRYSMHGGYHVLVSGGGVMGEVVPTEVKEGEDPKKKPNLESIKLRFTVAPEALPG